MQDVCSRLIERTREFLDAASAADAVLSAVDPEFLFELVTANSWGIDRFGDDMGRARERVALATAGVVGPA